MSIVVTGATGHLGRLIIESLLRRGVPADDLVAVGRDVTKIDDLAASGVVVRQADYDDAASLESAFAGAEKLMFVSSSAVSRRLVQHRNVIAAAQAASVGLVVYTSILNARNTSLALAADHRVTEEALEASGLATVMLRNGWYLENFTPQFRACSEGGIIGAAGDGRFSAATREDLAEAAAAVLAPDGLSGQVYELGGEAFTLAELAAEITRQTGRETSYTDLPEKKYLEVLVSSGVPEPMATSLADADRAARIGELYVERTDLEKLLGRPVTPLAEAVRAAL